jgi:hypothetical protein
LAVGVLQLIPLHGSPLQTPALQPKEQYCTCVVYVHPPDEVQLPGDTYTVRWVASEQNPLGGALQVTPTQGSLLHLPPLQPAEQVTCDDV